MTAGRFAAVAATLAAAHHVGDFMAQTDHQSLRKPAASDRTVECSEGESWRALAAHVASYHAVQVGALAAANRSLGLGLSPRRMAAGVGLSAVSHAVIDRRWPVRTWMDRTGSRAFREHGGAMYVDQTMHHACLWASALIIAGGCPVSSPARPEGQTAHASCPCGWSRSATGPNAEADVAQAKDSHRCVGR